MRLRFGPIGEMTEQTSRSDARSSPSRRVFREIESTLPRNPQRGASAPARERRQGDGRWTGPCPFDRPFKTSRPSVSPGVHDPPSRSGRGRSRMPEAIGSGFAVLEQPAIILKRNPAPLPRHEVSKATLQRLNARCIELKLDRGGYARSEQAANLIGKAHRALSAGAVIFGPETPEERF